MLRLISIVWRRVVLVALMSAVTAHAESGPVVRPPVSLRETVAMTPFHDLDQARDISIRGSVQDVATKKIWLRVTDSFGRSATATVKTKGGKFSARFPKDFRGAAELVPAMYFIDAALSEGAAPSARGEAAVIVFAAQQRRLPDLPSAFTTDLRGADGSVDAQSPEWARMRAMTNLYYHSRSAQLAGADRPGFDLAKPADLAAFKRDVALYDFDARDRDWATPLGRRVARSFWQAVWDSWFGPSNDNERPAGSGIYPAFTFANDTADILVSHLRRWRVRPATEQPVEDDLATLCNEVLRNLAAMQRKENDSAPVQLGVEGPGAFYYGMFADGELMLDGTGWFHGGKRGDHRRGGVFLGRSLWAIGEALGQPLPGMPETTLRETLRLGLRWGFGLARTHSDEGQPYIRAIKARDGSKTVRALWRSPGEHAYLLLGLLAACERKEIAGLTIFEAGEFGYAEKQTVASLTQQALDALADAVQPEGYWSTFADIDATAVEAMARGASVFAGNPSAARWRDVAVKVADGWLAAKPVEGAYRGPVLLPVGRRVPGQPGELRYRAHESSSTHLTYFHAGLWLQALAELEVLTGDVRYTRRFEEVAGYFCGNNPFDARMFTELGGVYNFVTDTDGDTVEDRLHFDLYPESTAFVHIGVLRHLQQRAGLTPNPAPKP
ncbi:hypothetical protein [Oleiharenicola lentus]|uniref:hypothetical protein n=1 Tax=Oleiharenicola lentus TaxID=2508720 RepID=UPI003F665030